MPHQITEDSVDDLMHRLLEQLFASGRTTHPSRGEALELAAVSLGLSNSRARLSRTARRGRLLVSALGELCWYLSGSADLKAIEYYLPKYKESAVGDHVPSAYGPRLLNFDGINQLERVVDMLRDKLWTRRAVVQLYDHEDLTSGDDDVPCTCVLQFLLRDASVELIVYMRSNDAHLGLPHDIFCFTMIQEYVSRLVGVEPGTYTHIAGSMHLYATDREKARAYLEEGWQSPGSMPPMPAPTARDGMDWLLRVERELRTGDNPLAVDLNGPDPYWSDLARLLAIWALIKHERFDEVRGIRTAMQSNTYDLYIADRLAE